MEPVSRAVHSRSKARVTVTQLTHVNVRWRRMPAAAGFLRDESRPALGKSDTHCAARRVRKGWHAQMRKGIYFRLKFCSV